MFFEGEEVTAKIYCLKYNVQPFYVGCTTQSLGERLEEHRSCTRGDDELTDLYDYIKNNRDVVIETIEEVKYKYDKRFGHRIGLMYEDYWIKEYKKRGHRIKNKRQIDIPKRERRTQITPFVVPNKSTTPKVLRVSIIAVNLRNARKFYSLTQGTASSKIGIKRSLLGAYEEGRAEPSIERLKTICKVYKVDSLNDFVTKEIDFFKTCKDRLTYACN